MKSHSCCEVGAKRRTWTQRGHYFAGWAIPGTLLLLMPKCPMCLAVCVLMGMGVGMSLTTATYLRDLLIVLCTVSLSFVALRQVRRFIERVDATRNRV